MIDKSTFDYYKYGYVSYVNNLKAFNIKGKYYEEVERNYNRMLELGEECNDETEFKDKLEKENILTNLYCYYNQAVAEFNAKNNVNGGANPNGGYASASAADSKDYVVDSILNTAVTPLLYRIPVLGILIGPLASLVRYIVRFFRKRSSNKSGKKNDGSANASSTHTRRTS